jgi:acyl transferase domain-containing protein
MAKGVMELPGAKERFAAASELLGRDLLAICNGEAQGELVDLNDTRNTQPALFVVETLLVDALRAQGRQAQLVAGHSLGELVALYAAGVFDAYTGLRLIHSRSSLMASAGVSIWSGAGVHHQCLHPWLQQSFDAHGPQHAPTAPQHLAGRRVTAIQYGM